MLMTMTTDVNDSYRSCVLKIKENPFWSLSKKQVGSDHTKSMPIFYLAQKINVLKKESVHWDKSYRMETGCLLVLLSMIETYHNVKAVLSSCIKVLKLSCE